MNVLIVGASAGLGRALAEEAAKRGSDLLLVASDERDVAAVSQHVRITYGIRAEYTVCDLADATAACEVTLRAVRAFGCVDAVLFPAGHSRDDDEGSLRADLTESLFHINLITQTLLIGALWPSLEERQAASIVGFGSVAAIRGRGHNVVYAAAKRGLQSFYESLMHKSVGTSIRVQFYQVGYLDTPRNAGKKLPLPAGSPAAFARRILDRLQEPAHRVYFYPGYWRFAAALLRITPWFLYKRMRF